ENVRALGAGHADEAPARAVQHEAVLVAQLARALAHERETVPVLLGQQAGGVEVVAGDRAGAGRVTGGAQVRRRPFPQVQVAGQRVEDVGVAHVGGVAAAAAAGGAGDQVLRADAVADLVVRAGIAGGGRLEPLPVFHLADAVGVGG